MPLLEEVERYLSPAHRRQLALAYETPGAAIGGLALSATALMNNLPGQRLPDLIARCIFIIQKDLRLTTQDIITRTAASVGQLNAPIERNLIFHNIMGIIELNLPSEQTATLVLAQAYTLWLQEKQPKTLYEQVIEAAIMNQDSRALMRNQTNGATMLRMRLGALRQNLTNAGIVTEIALAYIYGTLFHPSLTLEEFYTRARNFTEYETGTVVELIQAAQRIAMFPQDISTVQRIAGQLMLAHGELNNWSY